FPSGSDEGEPTSTGFTYNYNADTNTYFYTVKYGMCEYSVSDSSGNIFFSDAVFNLDSGYLANMGPDYQRSEVINYIDSNVRYYESAYYSKYLADDSSGDSGDSDDSGTTEGDSGDSGTTGGDSGDSGTTGGDSGTTGGDSGITDEDSGSSGGSSSGGGSSGGG
ncbi:TPA: hypothetical protein U0A14_004935, partial [Escherichia coli]|nr:hypothetical protein [Escherichia coli]